MTKGFVVCHAHIGLTKLNINSRRKKEPRLLCVMLLVYPIPTGFLINVEWPIGNDAEDKRGCQGVQIIIGKPVNGHLRGGGHKLGPLQIQPLTHSAPIVKIWENYTNDNIHVPISVLLKEC